MRIASLVAYTCHGAAALLIGSVRMLVLLVMMLAFLLGAFVLAAQSTRYVRASEWHPVPNAELLEILKAAVTGPEDPSPSNIVAVLLDLPASLTCFLLAAILFLVLRLIDRLDKRYRAFDPGGVRRQAVISDIEKALAHRPGEAAWQDRVHHQ